MGVVSGDGVARPSWGLGWTAVRLSPWPSGAPGARQASHPPSSQMSLLSGEKGQWGLRTHDSQVLGPRWPLCTRRARGGGWASMQTSGERATRRRPWGYPREEECEVTMSGQRPSPGCCVLANSPATPHPLQLKHHLYKSFQSLVMLRGPHGKVSGSLCSPKVMGAAGPHLASVLGLQPSQGLRRPPPE